MQARQSYEDNMKDVHRSNQILNKLERKMNSYFPKQAMPNLKKAADNERKREATAPSKPSNLVIFSTKKPAEESRVAPRREKEQSDKVQKLQKPRQDFFKEIELIDSIVSRKLELKRQRRAQLAKEVREEQEEKIRLYNINVQLERELKRVTEHQESEQNNEEVAELERESRRLRKILLEKQNEGKQLRKEEEALQTALRTASRSRKEYVSRDVKVAKSRSAKEDEQCLRGLVTELDRLKHIVQRRIHPSKSRKQIRC